jgi:molybdopterin converting factor small subunit
LSLPFCGDAIASGWQFNRQPAMNVHVSFYSYFKELTGTAGLTESLPEGGTIDDLCRALGTRFPKLASMRKSTLVAVGVEYQGGDYVLKDGDEVSLFPPVQGG